MLNPGRESGQGFLFLRGIRPVNKQLKLSRLPASPRFFLPIKNAAGYDPRKDIPAAQHTRQSKRAALMRPRSSSLNGLIDRIAEEVAAVNIP